MVNTGKSVVPSPMSMPTVLVAARMSAPVTPSSCSAVSGSLLATSARSTSIRGSPSLMIAYCAEAPSASTCTSSMWIRTEILVEKFSITTRWS